MRKVMVGGLTVLLFAASSQALFINIVESRLSDGTQNPLYTQNGPAVTTAKSTASGLSGTGSYYAGDTTPVKWGDWAYTPASGNGGYYNVYATWANYTTPGGCNWVVNYAGGQYLNSALQQTGSNGNAWNLVTTGGALLFNASTEYKTRLNTNAGGTSGKRVYFDSIKWEAATPGAPTGLTVSGGTTNVPLTGVGNELEWTAGTYSSFFDVFLSTDGGSTWGSAQRVTSATYDPDAYPLLANQTYTWKVVAGNVDMSTSSGNGSFVTAPEPATMLALALGCLFLIRRRP